MNSGSFFRLNLDTSKVVEGITFYDYIDVPDFSDGADCLQFPIKVAVTSESVTFFVHFFGEYKRNLTNEKDRQDEFLRPHHAEETILYLPYGSSNPEELSSSIKHIYNTSFPISNYLKELLKYRYVKEYDKQILTQKEKEYKRIRDSEVNLHSFSSLSIWGLLHNKRICVTRTRNVDSTISKFLRKLLLDFMFDLMHSDVFESSKYYSQMREGLMNDFFFSSIVKKSEYYYYRRLVKNRLSSVIESEENSKDLIVVVKEIREKNKKRKRRIWWNQLFRPNNSDIINSINVEYEADVESIGRNQRYSRQAYDTVQSVKNLYAEKLDESEAEWIDVIMNSLADKHFSFCPEWYEDLIPRKKRSQFHISESWFVNPEEEMSRIVFPLKDANKKVHYLNSFELGALTSSGDISSVLQRNTKISNWFYRRFDFVDAFRIHFFKHWNHFFAALLLAFCIVAMIPEFWKTPQIIALFPIGMAIGLIVAVIYFRLSQLGKNYAIIDDLLISNRRKRAMWKSLRYSLFFAAIGTFLICYNYWSSHWICILVKVLLLFGISVLLLYIIKPRVHIIDNIHLFLPRLVASITTAWIMIVIGNDLVKERISWPVCVILGFVVFAFILYESNKSLPNITTGARVWRTLELMLISFSISLIIGIIAIDVLSPSLLTDIQGAIDDPNQIAPNTFMELKNSSVDWHFVKGNSDFTISFIPQYLIQFSFLAMFIGIFIQMIFEEKNITEM